MTLTEAIAHSKSKSKELCGECANEHKQLAIWLTDLQDLMENGYGNFTAYINKHIHDYTIAAMQGRLSSNSDIASEDMAKIVAKDVKAMMEELRFNYPFKKVPLD